MGPFRSALARRLFWLKVHPGGVLSPLRESVSQRLIEFHVLAGCVRNEAGGTMETMGERLDKAGVGLELSLCLGAEEVGVLPDPVARGSLRLVFDR